jgi:hypothetical protein
MNGSREQSGIGESDRVRDEAVGHVASMGRSAFLPVLLVGLSVFVWFGYQTVLLLQERKALAAAHASQEAQVQSAGKVRQSLDAIARDTARLAARGHPGARLILGELDKRGITINPEVPPPAK